MSNLSEEEKQAIKHLERFAKRIEEEKYNPEAEIGLDTSINDVLDSLKEKQEIIEDLSSQIAELKTDLAFYKEMAWKDKD